LQPRHLHALLNIKGYINNSEASCIYCRNKCPLEKKKSSFDEWDLYLCKKCQESFIVYYDLLNEDTADAFSFTCKGITIYQDYNDIDVFLLRKYESKGDAVSIPFFEIDFSDKERLFKKIKTYLMLA
jgi:hypothetical protein